MRQIMNVLDMMTDGQIEVAVNQLRDAMRKHRGEVPKGTMQKVLGIENFGMRLFAVIRTLAEEINQQIVHIREVNRGRSPLEALKACGRKLYVTESVAAAMPRGTGKNVRLIYFKPGPECYRDGLLSCVALAQEYKNRGLVPDPQAQIDDNAANPEFADTMPNACQWVDADGNYCCAAFNRWADERDVYVGRGGGDWCDDWSFAGVPEESSASVV